MHPLEPFVAWEWDTIYNALRLMDMAFNLPQLSIRSDEIAI